MSSTVSSRAAAKAQRDAEKAAAKAQRDAEKAVAKAQRDAEKAAAKAQRDAARAAAKSQRPVLTVPASVVTFTRIEDANAEIATLRARLSALEAAYIDTVQRLQSIRAITSAV